MHLIKFSKQSTNRRYRELYSNRQSFRHYCIILIEAICSLVLLKGFFIRFLRYSDTDFSGLKVKIYFAIIYSTETCAQKHYANFCATACSNRWRNQLSVEDLCLVVPTVSQFMYFNVFILIYVFFIYVFFTIYVI